MKLLVYLLPLIAVLPVHADVVQQVAIYGGGPLYSGNNPQIQSNIDNLKSSGFNTVIGWSVHIYSDGTLVYNGDRISSNGQYVGDPAWPSLISQLKSGQTSVKRFLLSVGSADVGDFQNIAKLIQTQGTGSDSILYRNFAALKQAIPDLDGIELDDEDYLDQSTIVSFSLMLGAAGLRVSFCPYMAQDVWISSLKAVNSQSTGLVTHFNLQCYAGGSGNDPVQWQKAISDAGFSIPVFAGVMCQQAGGSAPGEIQSRFKTWSAKGITGGFIWLYDNVLQPGPSASDYASAVNNGLKAKFIIDKMLLSRHSK